MAESSPSGEASSTVLTLTDDVIIDIAKQVPYGEYHALGVKLGLSWQELDNVLQKNVKNYTLSATEILMTWKTEHGSGPAERQELGCILMSAGLRNLARKYSQTCLSEHLPTADTADSSRTKMPEVVGAVIGARISIDEFFKIKKSIESNTGLRLRPKHNTHITNLTSEPIRVILKHSNGGVEIRTLEKKGSGKNQICIPTPRGNVEVYAIRKDPATNGQFLPYADCSLGDKTDYSFFVEMSSLGSLTLERAKYGTTTEREGVRRR